MQLNRYIIAIVKILDNQDFDRHKNSFYLHSHPETLHAPSFSGRKKKLNSCTPMKEGILQLYHENGFNNLHMRVITVIWHLADTPTCSAHYLKSALS
jgi:hypothetical protein